MQKSEISKGRMYKNCHSPMNHQNELSSYLTTNKSTKHSIKLFPKQLKFYCFKLEVITSNFKMLRKKNNISREIEAKNS